MAPKMKQVILCTVNFYREFKCFDPTKVEKVLNPDGVDWDKNEPDPESLIKAVAQFIEELKNLLSKVKTEEEEMDLEVYGDAQKKNIKKESSASLACSSHSYVASSSKEQCEGNASASELNPDLVQVKAGKAEIERRINAFIERKQLELDDNNKREFCSVTSLTETEGNCARTDAVFVPREGCKSHVKVTRVVNKYGPQTRPLGVSPGRVQHQPELPSGGQHPQQEKKPVVGVPEAVDERLKNMESHLKLKKGSHVSRDVYERLKILEDRILQLESLSPEYFTAHGPPAPKRRSVDHSRQLRAEQSPHYAKYQAMSSSDIDRRIQELKADLRNRQNYPAVGGVKQEPPGDT